MQAILGKGFPFPLDSKSVDLPELQGTPEYIAAEKCRLAAKEVCLWPVWCSVLQIDGPTMVEDTSLCFDALGGLPGPYIKHFLETLGHDGLNRMLNGFDSRTAYAQCIFALSLGPQQEPMLFVGRTPGSVSCTISDR